MNLTRDDLIQKCTACKGIGWIEDPPSDPKQGSYGVRRVNMQMRTSCTVCHQTGEVFTETGEAITQVVSLMSRQHRF